MSADENSFHGSLEIDQISVRPYLSELFDGEENVDKTQP
jgi:hypothetical protein